MTVYHGDEEHTPANGTGHPKGPALFTPSIAGATDAAGQHHLSDAPANSETCGIKGREGLGPGTCTVNGQRRAL
jgi:hypothetical protein